jgi:hypothetical protein
VAVKEKLSGTELMALEYTFRMTLDEFLVAAVAEEMFQAPPVDTAIYQTLYREFNEAVTELRENGTL